MQLTRSIDRFPELLICTFQAFACDPCQDHRSKCARLSAIHQINHRLGEIALWQVEAHVYSFCGLHDITALFLSSKGLATQAVRYLKQSKQLQVSRSCQLFHYHIFSLQLALAVAYCRSLHVISMENRDSCTWVARLITNNASTLRSFDVFNFRQSLLPRDATEALPNCKIDDRSILC